MGIGPKNLMKIRELSANGLLAPRAEILELGAQEVYCEGGEEIVRAFVDFYVGSQNVNWSAVPLSSNDVIRLARRGFSAELFRACGFRYCALDIFDGDGVTLFDLNINHVPADLKGRFDLVTNFGTTEHVINQLLLSIS